jgi:hypothetical protein
VLCWTLRVRHRHRVVWCLLLGLLAGCHHVRRRSPRPCCAIVQIAVLDTVWILDCLPALENVAYSTQVAVCQYQDTISLTLVSLQLDVVLAWVFSLPSPHARVGFAFSEDVRHLQPLVPTLSASQLKHVVDVQLIAGSALGLKRPGLTTVCRHMLTRPLNKSNQTSNWERRPLRPDQLAYASVDAWCLLQLYALLSAPELVSSLAS